MTEAHTGQDRELERLLADLVAADSSNPPGNEAAAAAVVVEAARRLGLPQPRRHERESHRPNLLYALGSGAPTLLIGCHLDTVPAGDATAWTTDPLTLTRDGDRYRGLGVADMKGAIAALLVSASTLELQHRRGRVVLAFTADEEASSDFGLSWLCREGLIEADAAVLLEPASASEQSWDALYAAQRGSCVVRLEASGRPGHSGEPLPVSLRAGSVFLAALNAFAQAQLFSELRHPLDGTPPLVNLPTMVAGGVTPWQHPARFEAVIEIRSIPGMTAITVQRTLDDVLDAHSLRHRVRATIESWSDPTPPANDDRLLNACNNALAAVISNELPTRVFPATTDATFLADAGVPTIPAFGPGSVRAIHQPDEWIRRSDLGKAVRLVHELVGRYLTE